MLYKLHLNGQHFSESLVGGKRCWSWDLGPSDVMETRTKN